MTEFVQQNMFEAAKRNRSIAISEMVGLSILARRGAALLGGVDGMAGEEAVDAVDERRGEDGEGTDGRNGGIRVQKLWWGEGEELPYIVAGDRIFGINQVSPLVPTSLTPHSASFSKRLFTRFTQSSG